MTSPKPPLVIPIPILLLKTKSTPNDSYEEYFSSTSSLPLFTPIFVPVLEHRPNVQNLEVAKRSLRDGGDGALRSRRMGRYGGMIFTSQRAVEGFAGVVGELEGEQRIAARSAEEDVEMMSREGGRELTQSQPQPPSPFPPNPTLVFPFYTVGPATSRTLSTLLHTSSTVLSPLNPQILGSHTGNGEVLAHYILEHYPTLFQSPQFPQPTSTTASTPKSNNNDDDNGDDFNHGDSNNNLKGELPPLLFLVGDQRRDIIPKTVMSPSLPREQRVQVDELVVYETGVMASFAEDLDRAIRTCQRQGTSASRDPTDQENSEILQLDGSRSQSLVSDVIVVVVFSPSGCRETLQRLGLLDEKSRKLRSKYPSGPSLDHRGASSESHIITNLQADENVLPPPSKTTPDQKRFVIATIGPTTREYMRQQFHFEVDICAEKPSPEGVGEGVKKYLQQQRMLPE